MRLRLKQRMRPHGATFFYGVFLRSGLILTQRHANKRNRDKPDLAEITYENGSRQTHAKGRKIAVSNYEFPALTAELQARMIVEVKHSKPLVTNPESISAAVRAAAE